MGVRMGDARTREAKERWLNQALWSSHEIDLVNNATTCTSQRFHNTEDQERNGNVISYHMYIFMCTSPVEHARRLCIHRHPKHIVSQKRNLSIHETGEEVNTHVIRGQYGPRSECT